MPISEKILTTLWIDIQWVKDNLNYSWIGVGLDTSTSYEWVSYPVITYVYKNSPAFNIWLETYDIITMIDNESVKDQSPDTVSAKLRWSIWSKVVLIIERPQANNKRMRIEKNITRAIIEVSSTPTYEYTLDWNPITQYTQRIESILACEKNIVLVEQDPIGDSSGTLDGYFVKIGKSIPIRNRIKKYAIQQPNGDWVEYNLWDPNPSYPETKNSRSDFTDHTFKILECYEYATGNVELTGTIEISTQFKEISFPKLDYITVEKSVSLLKNIIDPNRLCRIQNEAGIKECNNDQNIQKIITTLTSEPWVSAIRTDFIFTNNKYKTDPSIYATDAEAEEPVSYMVYIIPNIFGYKTLQEAKNARDYLGPTQDPYRVIQVSPNYIMFDYGCYPVSERSEWWATTDFPFCNEIAQKIIPNIILN